LEWLRLKSKSTKKTWKNGSVYKCDNRAGSDFDKDSAGYFIPVEVGSLSESNPQIVYTGGQCWTTATFTYSQTGTSNDIGDVIVTVDVEKAKSLWCKDWFFFATTEFYHVESFRVHGTHTIKFANLGTNAKIDVVKNGIKIYMMCDGYIDTFISAFHMVEAFVGGLGTNPDKKIFGSHVPPYMEKANIDFLHDLMGMEFVERN